VQARQHHDQKSQLPFVLPAEIVQNDRLLPKTADTYSLHVRVRAFTGVSDEAFDPRRDNGQRHRAKLEHRIGMVTTALPSKCGKGDTFKS